ncbi:MAG: SDR family NAD(P)-dependent oxidoreductase [Chloroflexi bacterium]|nr:SDR family NAD(P)-dependent oxidoreductase [Chloroflexota bacterium]
MGFIRERLSLAGEVAVVTGAGSGIGRAIALGLADIGARVVVGELDEGSGRATAAAIEERGGESLSVPTDVREREQVQRLIDEAIERFGDLHVMVNNVGGSFQLPTLDLSDNGLEAVLRINLKAMFLGSQIAARAMIAAGHGGSIVSTSSGSALQGDAVGSAHYSAAKAAILGMTRALAAEWSAHGIRVNAIAPGGVNTPGRVRNMREDVGSRAVEHAPLRRLAEPEEIAAGAVFLASGLASYVTGHTLVIDGGGSTTGIS